MASPYALTPPNRVARQHTEFSTATDFKSMNVEDLENMIAEIERTQYKSTSYLNSPKVYRQVWPLLIPIDIGRR